jgi:hypothetical protein
MHILPISRPALNMRAALWLCALLMASSAGAVPFSGGILTSVEVYHEQIGAGTTAVRYYNAFDEAFTEEGTPPLSSLSVTSGGKT